MPLKKKFSARLKSLREQNDITMQTIANAIGKKRPAISQFELGLNLPSIDTLIAIADFFNVSLDYLTGRTRLFSEPDGLLEYQFLDDDGTLQQGVLKYSFGIFPLEHFVSTFLYLENAKGNLIKKILSSKGQLNFLALIGILNEKLHLGYCLNKKENGLHIVNLIIKESDELHKGQRLTIDKLNLLPRYKEIKSGTALPVVLDDIFYGYEEFIRHYLSLSTPEKVDFLTKWLENK